MIAWARTKIASSFPWHCRGDRCGRLGERRTNLLCKGIHAARDDGIVAQLATVSKQPLPDPLGRSLPLPAMVGIPVSATPFFIRSACPFAENRARGRRRTIPASAALLPIPSRSSGVSIAGSQKVVYNEISDITAQSLPGGKVEEKMLPSKDAAQRCFLCGSRKVCE
jgi:hypothetical protein